MWLGVSQVVPSKISCVGNRPEKSFSSDLTRSRQWKMQNLSPKRPNALFSVLKHLFVDFFCNRIAFMFFHRISRVFVVSRAIVMRAKHNSWLSLQTIVYLLWSGRQGQQACEAQKYQFVSNFSHPIKDYIVSFEENAETTTRREQ